MRAKLKASEIDSAEAAQAIFEAALEAVEAAFASQTWLAVTLLTLCMGCMRLITASSNSAPMDLAPSRAASLTSIQNT